MDTGDRVEVTSDEDGLLVDEIKYAGKAGRIVRYVTTIHLENTDNWDKGEKVWWVRFDDETEAGFRESKLRLV